MARLENKALSSSLVQIINGKAQARAFSNNNEKGSSLLKYWTGPPKTVKTKNVKGQPDSGGLKG